MFVGLSGLPVAMSKRQRFFVELREGEVTVISWKKLVADAERAAAAAAPPLNANKIPENLNTAENSLKPRRKLKLDAASSKATERKGRGRSLGDRNINSSGELQPWEEARKQKANVKMIKAVKDEFAKPGVTKGKVHRSMPIPCASGGAKTSCRTKKKTRACFCCSKKSNRT